MLCLLLGIPLTPVSELVSFAAGEWRKQPETRIADAYKWIFHATRGGEHAIADESGPRKWMDREWGSLDRPQPNEPEMQRLSPTGKIVRINMRPYRQRGGDREMLLAVFVASASRFRSDKSDFVREWKSLGSVLNNHPIGKVALREWRDLDAKMKPLGYPAIHHSPEYERAYKPAYRVVVKDLWSE